MKLFFNTIIFVFAFVGLEQSALASGSYHVEALIFSNGGGSTGAYSNSPADAPDFGSSWALNTAYLKKSASKIRNSGNYSVVKHIAWGVRSLPYSRSAAHTINGSGVNGWVKIFAKSLLFAHIDVVHNGSRLQEKRRLKLNEVHYFDNESFGMLLRVSRSKG